MPAHANMQSPTNRIPTTVDRSMTEFLQQVESRMRNNYPLTWSTTDCSQLSHHPTVPHRRKMMQHPKISQTTRNYHPQEQVIKSPCSSRSSSYLTFACYQSTTHSYPTLHLDSLLKITIPTNPVAHQPSSVSFTHHSSGFPFKIKVLPFEEITQQMCMFIDPYNAIVLKTHMICKN